LNLNFNQGEIVNEQEIKKAHARIDAEAERLIRGECATEASCSLGGDVRYVPPTIRTTVEVAANRSFSDALHALKCGQRITRRGWNGGGMWVSAQYPDKGSKMGVPYAYLKNVNNELVPWLPSQGDLFAEDWAILPIQPI
jgi:hypothetical protein